MFKTCMFYSLPGNAEMIAVNAINSTAVLISWNPPFTLEGIPILGYSLAITTTSEESKKFGTFFVLEF